MVQRRLDALRRLHDGHLTGMRLLNEATVELALQTPSGTEVTIRIGSVLELVADNFRLGNIVLAAEIVDAVSLPRDHAARLLQRSPNDPDLGQHWSRSALSKGRALRLESSSGCDLCVVFADPDGYSIEEWTP